MGPVNTGPALFLLQLSPWVSQHFPKKSPAGYLCISDDFVLLYATRSLQKTSNCIFLYFGIIPSFFPCLPMVFFFLAIATLNLLTMLVIKRWQFNYKVFYDNTKWLLHTVNLKNTTNFRQICTIVTLGVYLSCQAPFLFVEFGVPNHLLLHHPKLGVSL